MKFVREFAFAVGAVAVSAPAMAQELTPINLMQGAPRVVSSYPIIVAEALGYFEQEGVAFNLLPTSEKVPFVAFLSNGQADVAKLDAGSVFAAVDIGVPIKVVYEVMQRSPDGIQVAEASAIQSVEDLRGKTLGLVSDRDLPTAEIALSYAGLTLDDVSTAVVGEGGPTLANALRDNTVDAIVGSMADWAGLQANGIVLRNITPPAMAEVPGNSFVVNANRFEELKEPMIGFLRAWAKGAAAGGIDPETVARIVARVSPEEFEDPEFGRSYLGVSVGMNSPVTPEFGAIQNDIWVNIEQELRAHDQLSQEIDVTTFLDPSLTAEVNNFDEEQIKADLQKWAEENPE